MPDEQPKRRDLPTIRQGSTCRQASSIDAWQVVCFTVVPPWRTWSDEEGAGDGAPPRRARSHQPRSGPGRANAPGTQSIEVRPDALPVSSACAEHRNVPVPGEVAALLHVSPKTSPAGPRTASCRSSAPSAGTAASPSARSASAARLVGECASTVPGRPSTRPPRCSTATPRPDSHRRGRRPHGHLPVAGLPARQVRPAADLADRPPPVRARRHAPHRTRGPVTGGETA